jgi:DNA invertase Pin-like site-specific DNA recombinase
MHDSRVASHHLSRDAYLYIRQSTLRQLSESGESTRRQYALRERAIALGWPTERIHIIDQDIGLSGAHSEGRDGFQALVAAVGLRKVGLVLGLEVSRLARNSVDWQQLLQLCAYTDTLILDEEAIYNPAAFNDRLLLGLKGTMSEAELHLLRSRLRGGILNKAQRGELMLRLPVGHDRQHHRNTTATARFCCTICTIGLGRRAGRNDYLVRLYEHPGSQRADQPGLCWRLCLWPPALPAGAEWPNRTSQAWAG